MKREQTGSDASIHRELLDGDRRLVLVNVKVDVYCVC